VTQSPPLTRETLIDMMLAYRRTALLRVGLELGVFDALAEHPADSTAVAARLGVRERGTRILLGALAAVGLLVTDGPRFRLPHGPDIPTLDRKEFGGRALFPANHHASRVTHEFRARSNPNGVTLYQPRVATLRRPRRYPG